MSKSLGNFFTIRQLLAEWPGEVLRLNMLRTHYRQPLDWTSKALVESKTILDEWYDLLADVSSSDAFPDDQVMQALCDDLNTPSVLTRLHALAGEIRGSAGSPHQIALRRQLKASGSLLGILEQPAEEYIRRDPLRVAVDESKVRNLIDARSTARKSRNFKQADLIRDELTSMGIEIEDHRDGTTTWRIRRRVS
jgi:cysteinyl-tRNA synthetase